MSSLNWFSSVLCFLSAFVVIDCGLYDKVDTVVQLNDTNFKEVIINQTNAFLVEFYASWCGHCQRFAPIFKEFAEDVSNWSPVFKPAVIDCPTNGQTCTEMDIWAYPTLSFVCPFATNITQVKKVTLLNRTPAGLVDLVTSKIRDCSRHLGDRSTLNWPRFSSVSRSELRTLTRQAFDGSLLVIEEDPLSDVGTKVILDMVPYRNQVKVYRFINVNSTTPKLGYINENGTIKYLTNVYESLLDKNRDYRKLFVDTIEFLFLNESIDGQTTTTTQTVNTIETTNNTTPSMPFVKGAVNETNSIHKVDLLSAVRYSIYNEILVHKTLSREERQTVQNYLRILIDYLPQTDKKVNRFLANFSRILQTSGQQPLETSLIKREMDNPSFGHLSKETVFKTCAGSQPHYRGYPCSLWLLFHTLTVSEYKMVKEKESNLNNFTVLDTMRAYVKHFFSCRNCADHFLIMSMNMKTETEGSLSSGSAVLWLWKAHNQVNQRLAKDKTEDPMHPKVQFPPSSICPVCRNPNGSWNDSNVLQFLVKRHSFLV